MSFQRTLESRNLTVGYNHHKVLADINLKANEEELICLMGLNGTGKSTLLRTLCDLQSPLEGQVMINGRALNTINAKDKATFLSVVLTERFDLGYTTVQELVAMGRYPYTNWWGRENSKDDQVTQQCLTAIGLVDLADIPLRELSDGQKQKAMIGRALAQEGKVMLLDEPLIHLDVKARREVMQLLVDTTRKLKRTVIMATHELELSTKYADKIWLLTSGGMLTSGCPEDLMLNGTITQTFGGSNDYNPAHPSQPVFQPPIKHPWNVIGPEPHQHWTRHAIERKGWKLTDFSPNLRIEIKQHNGYPQWTLTLPDGKLNCNSIEELLNHIERLCYVKIH